MYHTILGGKHVILHRLELVFIRYCCTAFPLLSVHPLLLSAFHLFRHIINMWLYIRCLLDWSKGLTKDDCRKFLTVLLFINTTCQRTAFRYMRTCAHPPACLPSLFHGWTLMQLGSPATCATHPSSTCGANAMRNLSVDTLVTLLEIFSINTS